MMVCKKYKNSAQNNVRSLEVAPSPGLEPGTCGLTVRRSNQLSYEGTMLLKLSGFGKSVKSKMLILIKKSNFSSLLYVVIKE